MAENKDIEQNIILNYKTNADGTAKEVDKLTESVDNLSDTQGKTTKSNKELVGGIDSLKGPIGGAISGYKAMIKQMWLIVANPLVLTLVAIVGGLALLFKAFTSTKVGADKFEQVLAGIGAVIDILRDRVLKVAEAIGKFFSGDFKGALNAGKEAVKGFGDEVASEFKKAADATKSLQEVNNAMRNLGVTRAKLNRDLAETKEIITDENASFADKKKAIDDVRIAEEKQTKQELANAKKKLKAIKELNSLDGDATSDEDLQKAADAQAAVYKLEEEQAQNKRALSKQEKLIQREESARLKTKTDERKAHLKKQTEEKKKAEEEAKKTREQIFKDQLAAEENAQKQLENLQDKTEEQKLARQKERDLAAIESLKKQGVDVAEILRLNTEKYNILEDELVAKRRAEKKEKDDEYWAKEAEDAAKRAEDERIIDDAVLQQRQKNTDDILATGDALIAGAKMLAGKNKALQRTAIIAEGAMALGKVGVNIATGVSKDAATGAIASTPQIAKTLATGVFAATSIISNTSKALSSLGGGSAGGSSGGGSSSPSGGATPQVEFQTSSESQIGNTLARNVNDAPPVQAFVVSSEVTTAQSLDRNRINDNSF